MLLCSLFPTLVLKCYLKVKRLYNTQHVCSVLVMAPPKDLELENTKLVTGPGCEEGPLLWLYK